MVNCVIVDDEPRNIKVLKGMLEEFCPDLSIDRPPKQPAAILVEQWSFTKTFMFLSYIFNFNKIEK